MNKLSTYALLTALAVAGAALAQAPQTPPNPVPATSPDEGTAADKATPGKTPTQGAAEDTAVNPWPATSETEGTAADRSPPDKASTMQGRPGETVTGQSASGIVGLQVVSTSDAPLGEVVDVVFDAKNQPSFVVIASEGEAAAVPYGTANSMVSGDKVVMDQSRLARAPKVKQGEWRSSSSSNWKNDAARYWAKGQEKGQEKS